MIKDVQVRKLRQLLDAGSALTTAARRTGMDEKTARKYRDSADLPSEQVRQRSYRTRKDPFEEVWPEVQARLEAEPKLRPFTLFAWLQEKYPGRFSDAQRRTLERRVRAWRATNGPQQEVMFPQVHHPGQLAASDFTSMNALRITIAGQSFDHLLYHFTLTYSNWEFVSVCFSESFEAFSRGLQGALWELGGVPQKHRSDSLSAAVNNLSDDREFRSRYRDLLSHYRVDPQRINVRKAHENGDIESSHGHLKRVIDQALLLRGSRDFSTRQQYEVFLCEVIGKRNATRSARLAEEQSELGELPPTKIDYRTVLRGIKVSGSSTIQVKRNTYSVHSRLIGHKIDAVIDADSIELFYGDTWVQSMPRLLGTGKHAINYRHVIDSLVRKPGAFASYQYREEMFPTSHFRMAFDALCRDHSESVATREYLKILQLAARDSQDAVRDALRLALATSEPIAAESIRVAVEEHQQIPPATEVAIDPPDLHQFDSLLQYPDMEVSDENQNSQGERSQEDDCSCEAEDALDETSQQQRREDQERTDRPVPRSSHADVSRTLRTFGGESSCRIDESHSLSGGTDRPGMPGSAAESDHASDAPVSTAKLEDLVQFRLDTTASSSGSSAGELAGRFVSGPSREPTAVWQTGVGKESLFVRPGRATGAARPIGAVHHLQSSCAATAGCQT